MMQIINLKEFLENSAMFDGDINKGFERHARKYGAGSFTMWSII